MKAYKIFFLPLFGFLFLFSHGQSLIPFREGKKWGYCKPDKSLVLPCMYDEAAPFTNGLAIVKKGDKYGLINEKGGEILPFQYKVLEVQSTGHYRLQVGGYRTYGMADRTGKIILEPGYGYIGAFVDGYLYVNPPSGNSTYLDTNFRPFLPQKTGENILSGGIEGKFPFERSLDSVTAKTLPPDKKGKGYYDKIGNELYFQTEEEKINGTKPWKIYYAFHEELALSGRVTEKEGTRLGYIDANENVVIDFIYQSGSDFSNGAAWVMKDDKFGIIDKTGKILMDFKYSGAHTLTPNLFKLREDNGVYHLFNTKQKTSIAVNGLLAEGFANDGIWAWGEGLGLAKAKNGKYGYIDSLGRFVLPAVYDNAAKFKGGLANVLYNGEETYINRKGETFYKVPD